MTSTPLTLRTLTNLTSIADAEFRASWSTLAERCPWTTYCQRPPFVISWYETYQRNHNVVLLSAWDEQTLVGLLPMATHVDTGKPIVAGGHQAEYQGWIADPGVHAEFVTRVMRECVRRFGRHVVTFRYLPPKIPLNEIMRAGWRSRVTVQSHSRPLLRIDPQEIAKSLAKKSNKSRLNRLKRIGDVQLERIESRDSLENVIDEVAWQYDVRQGAVNQSLPFTQDPLKRTFYLNMMAHPGFLHVTMLRVGQTVVSAHIDHVDGKWVHLGLLSHSPFFVQHSPGKLHMLLLGKMLADEGIECFDLTPGDDPWKERFANDHDVVRLMTWYPNTRAKLGRQAPLLLKKSVSHALKKMGVSFNRRDVQRNDPSMAYGIDSLLHTIDSDSFGKTSDRAALNQPAHLLFFMGDETVPAKCDMLSKALRQLEQGAQLLTSVQSDTLVAYAWLSSGKIVSSQLAGASVPDESLVLHGITYRSAAETPNALTSLLTRAVDVAQKTTGAGALFALASQSVVDDISALGTRLERVEIELREGAGP